MTVLTPAQVITVALNEANTYVVSKDFATSTNVIANVKDPKRTEKVSQKAWEARIVQAARIMWAESGGDTNAVCYNVDDASGRSTCSKTGPAGSRGVDRGLWQFNNKAWPKITDVCAYDPVCATKAAYVASNGFTAFGSWSKSAGIDPSARRYDEVRAEIGAAWEAMQGTVVDDTPVLSQIDPDANGVPDFGLKVPVWADSLGRLLARLVDPAWWRRFGLGALGLLMVLIAVALTVADAKVV